MKSLKKKKIGSSTFEYSDGTLGDVLGTSWGRPESAFAERDQNDEILGFNLVFVGQIPFTLILSFGLTSCFRELHFQGFNLVTLNFEFLSVFLYWLWELL